MRNNKTTANAPLRTSETVDVLTQQIMGTLKREGSGQFENVVPEEPVKPVKEKAPKKPRDKPHFKQHAKHREKE